MSSSSSLNINSISDADAFSSSTLPIPKVSSELTSLITSFLDPETAKTLAKTLIPRMSMGSMIPSLTERAIISGHDVTNDQGITAHIDDINGMLADEVRQLLDVDQTPLANCSVGRRSVIIKKIEQICKERFKHWSNPRPDALLKAAAKNGSDTIVKGILHSDYFNTISRKALGASLHNAVENDHLEVVQFLLQNGAVLSGMDRGWVVQKAAEKGHLEFVKFLLQNGAEICSLFLDLAVAKAAEKGYLEVVKFLLQNGAEISNIQLGIVDAAEKGHLEVVKFLLQNGAVLSSFYMALALEKAEKNGHVAVVQFLQQTGNQ